MGYERLLGLLRRDGCDLKMDGEDFMVANMRTGLGFLQRLGRWISLTSILFASLGCATIAQWAAPDKKPQNQPPKELAVAENDFWTQFHLGKFDEIPRLIELYNGLYVLNPENSTIAARIGFLHVWRLAERRRFGIARATVIDDATLCRKFFEEAHHLYPKEYRYKGFYAACLLAEADIHRDERGSRKGYFLMKDAISDWPEFNLFTGGYVLSQLPWNGDLFDEGLEWQWETLDRCSGTKIDRKNPQYAQFMAQEVKTGDKRVCWNSWIAPHNFEGFFLNMGDMLVKKGDVATAKKIYAFAKLSKTYRQWPFKGQLEERIAKADEHVKYFRLEQKKEILTKDPHLMFHSEAACMACHQAK